MTPRAILIRATRSAVLPWLAAFRVRVVTHARDPNGKLYILDRFETKAN
jgi:hypothetical protein